MHRIDHETATSDHKFTEGNPTIPVPATVVTDDWLNAVQEELVAVITGAGLELEKSDNTQLWQAITTAVDNARPGLATTKNPGLVQIGDGLAITPEGLLSVLIASTSQAGLVKPRYGLKISKDGSLDVDFGDMPTDKFEELLKSIRVPIWLTKNLTIYVAPTGSDTLDQGRGMTEGKPFATLQAAIKFVADNYNLSSYQVTFRLAAGDYQQIDRWLALPRYTASTGIMVITGPSTNPADAIIDCVRNVYESVYRFENLTIGGKQETTASSAYNIRISAGDVTFQNVVFDSTKLNSAPDLTMNIYVNGGICNIPATSGINPNGVTFITKEKQQYIFRVDTSVINASADMTIIDSLVVSTATISVREGGVFRMSYSGSSSNPGRFPLFTGEVTGKRYAVETNGIINVAGRGPDVIPGSQDGSTSTGGQYT